MLRKNKHISVGIIAIYAPIFLKHITSTMICDLVFRLECESARGALAHSYSNALVEVF